MPEFVFSIKSPEAADVELEFADGRRVVPRWMVAHLGGTDAVSSVESMQRALLVTFEQFQRAFHEAVSRSKLNAIQKQIVSSHMRGIAGRIGRND
jgi:hypothetical protein